MALQQASEHLLGLVTLNPYAPLGHSVCEPEQYSQFENRGH